MTKHSTKLNHTIIVKYIFKKIFQFKKPVWTFKAPSRSILFPMTNAFFLPSLLYFQKTFQLFAFNMFALLWNSVPEFKAMLIHCNLNRDIPPLRQLRSLLCLRDSGSSDRSSLINSLTTDAYIS